MPFIDPVAAGLYDDPTTLAGVVRAVRDIFDAAGDATPIMMGKRYLEGNAVGREPRVLFVVTPGKVGPPIEMGNAASVTHACDAYCRGPESGDDVGRYDAAYLLGDKVISALRRAATGRLEWGAYDDSSPATVDGFGAEVRFSFTYQRDVPHTPAVTAVAAADAATATPAPTGMETGEAGEVEAVEQTTDVQDEAIV